MKQDQASKGVPMRTCIVTREKRPKKDLLRLVRLADGQVVVDAFGKARGRGANITPDMEVFDQAIKKGMLHRALKLEKKLTASDIAELRKSFEEAIELKNFRPSNKPVKIRVSKKELEKVKG